MKIKLDKEQAAIVLKAIYNAGQYIPVANFDGLYESPLGVSFEMKAIKPERTRSQEKYYRKWCGEFAKHIGISPDNCHEVILCEAFGTTFIKVRESTYAIPYKRSADTNRDTYSQLIETLIRCAAFANFIVPPAERAA